MSLKNVVIFLFINLVIAIAIGLNFFFQDKAAEKAANTQEYKQEIITAQNTKPIEDPKTVLAAPPTENTQIITTKPDPVCAVLGPFNIDEKASVDVLISKNKTEQEIRIEKKPVFQIYWNLGRNEANARKLFETQKAGALQDEKFTLVQNEKKEWIVPITQVHTNAEVAQKLATELGEKANKVNAGGQWAFVERPEAYFYFFKDYAGLDKVVADSISLLVGEKKQPC